MYIFTLVDDVEKVVEKLREHHGEFTLAMLYNNSLDADTSWNLIVSGPWTDVLGVGEATRVIARALNQGLGAESQHAISRVTVLKTSDPFVRDMTRLYPVRDGARVPVAHVTAGQIAEGSGFILYSQIIP
ncbi:MAG: hypothetical protein WAK91_02435 [Candidatus Acidiferrales bacterium]|jgi:uncharacterized protein YciI